jgi:hypothetical protein
MEWSRAMLMIAYHLPSWLISLLIDLLLELLHRLLG